MAPDVTDDRQILDLEDVFRQHAALVYRTARAITGSSEEAEDIAFHVESHDVRAGARGCRRRSVYFTDTYVDSDKVLPADAPFKVEACKELAPEYQPAAKK